MQMKEKYDKQATKNIKKRENKMKTEKNMKHPIQKKRQNITIHTTTTNLKTHNIHTRHRFDQNNKICTCLPLILPQQQHI